MKETIKCSDCGGEMELGFVPDATYGAILQTAWHQGDPKEKKTILEKLKTGAGVQYDPKRMIPITSYRCSGCGVLKFYATPDSDE